MSGTLNLDRLSRVSQRLCTVPLSQPLGSGTVGHSICPKCPACPIRPVCPACPTHTEACAH